MPPTRAEFIELERHCAARPDDRDARRRLLQLFVALGQPADLPGSSLTLPPSELPPSVAVLTPYFKESLATLQRCHASVREQTIRCEHIVVADGHARAELDHWGLRHIRIATPSSDFGDTPRRIAGEAAIESGFDAVVYLDADNWLRPRHVESLLACRRARGALLCHSARTFHRIGGTLLPLLWKGDNVDHVDTSCVFVAREAFELLPLWGAWPRELSRIDDRMFWQAALARGFSQAFTGALTTCYEASHVSYYREVGEPAPAGARPDIDIQQLRAWHAALPPTERNDLDGRFGFSVTALLGRWAPPAR